MIILRLSEGEASVSKTDEYFVNNEEICIKNEEICIKNKDFCIKNKELFIQNDEFCRLRLTQSVSRSHGTPTTT